MSSIVIIVLLGLFVGIIAPFFGIGGGLFIIPSLYELFPELTVPMVISTTLSMVFFNSIINTYKFRKKGIELSPKIVLYVSIGCIVGILIAGQLALKLDENILKVIFGIYLFILAIKTLRSKPNTSELSKTYQETPTQKLVIVGLLSGVVAGFTGLGGGSILVPLFLSIVKVPIKKVSAYSTSCLISTSLVGALRFGLSDPVKISNASAIIDFGQIGNINFIIVICMLFGALFGQKYGIALNHKIDSKTKNISFAMLLFFISIRIFIKNIPQLFS